MPAYEMADEAEAALDALGDPTRRRILTLLRGGAASVADVARQVPVSRPAVSQHLRVLRDAGLVTFDSHGTRNLYRLDPDGAARLRRWLDDLWDTVLGDFERYARRRHSKGTTP